MMLQVLIHESWTVQCLALGLDFCFWRGRGSVRAGFYQPLSYGIHSLLRPVSAASNASARLERPRFGRIVFRLEMCTWTFRLPHFLPWSRGCGSCFSSVARLSAERMKMLQEHCTIRRTQHPVEQARRHSRRVCSRWLVILGVAGILVLPLVGMILQDFSGEGENYIRVYPLRYSADRSYDLISFLVPNVRQHILSTAGSAYRRSERVHQYGWGHGTFARPAIISRFHRLAHGAVGAIRFRRSMLFWILSALVFAILSLGPVLHIAGSATSLPLPFGLANNIPILNHIRIPMRYGLMVHFSVALLAGAGAFVLVSWKNWFVFPLAILILIEAAVLPYPTLEFRPPSVYEQIAREPGDFRGPGNSEFSLAAHGEK